MTVGLTPQGFRRKTLEEIKTSIESRILAVFPALNLESSLIRNLIDATADEEDLIWQAAEAVYHAQYPSSAGGAALVEVSAITGTVPRPATRSVVVATVTVDPGTYAAESLIAHVAGNPGSRFRNRNEVSNPGGSAAAFAAVFEAEVTGPVAAPEGALTVIAEPTSGWLSITNDTAAVLGLLAETDEELRIRREVELGARGTSTLDGIRGEASRIDGILQVRAFENVMHFEVGGIPPNSFEIVVYDGPTPTVDDEVIAQAIWDVKGGGIRAFGDTVVPIEATDGEVHPVGFSRAAGVEVWAEVDLEVEADRYAGDDAVKAAIVQTGALRQRIGIDVSVARYICTALDVEGVTDVLEIRLGIAPGPTGTTNIPIGPREIALLAESRIEVST